MRRDLISASRLFGGSTLPRKARWRRASALLLMRGQICQKWPGRASRSDHPVPLRALASLPFVSARYDNILAASCLDELRQNTSSTITASHIGMPSAYLSIHTPRILCVDCYSETGVGDLEVSHTGVSQCSVMMLHFAAIGGLLKSSGERAFRDGPADHLRRQPRAPTTCERRIATGSRP